MKRDVRIYILCDGIFFTRATFHIRIKMGHMRLMAEFRFALTCIKGEEQVVISSDAAVRSKGFEYPVSE